ncbi:unnamed protein product [Orchesella dallaii]|uniref:BTB domain-containing protein n=1 Tax=Orchesella dallaii TaxID=48710 RepID=A0ABP1QN27_9HEXA
MDNLKHPHTMVYLTPSSTLQNSYSINWNSQQSHILEGIKQLGGGGGDLEHDLFLTDVTLASCDGEYVPAHKLILSLCSTFFKNLFQRNRNLDKGSGSNTVLILGHVSGRNLRQLMEFIYQGRVEIPQEDVDSFLQAGTMLKIEGLVDSSGDDSQANSSTNFVTPTAGATLNVPVPPPPPPTSGQSNRAESSANSSNKKAKLHPPSNHNHNHLDSQDHSQSSSSTTTGGEVESIQFCQVELDVEVTSEEEGKGIVESSYFAGRVDPLQIFQYSSSSSSLPGAGETPEESSSSRRSSKRKRSASGGASTLILPNNVPPGAKQKRHPIWNMYHYDAEVNACMCLVSGCTSTLAGKKTTNLMRHLNYFHPDEFKKLFGEQSS